MKTIMIYAYTGFNLGDDLFIKVLCDRYSNIQFKLFAHGEYRNIFKDTTNLNVYPSNSIIIRVFNKLISLFCIDHAFEKILAKSTDACVYIGGSLFMQGAPWQEYFDQLRRKSVKGKPFFLSGCNFGPYTEEEFFYKHRELFSTYEDVCFRDTYSYNLFKELKNVRVADDILFGIKIDKTYYTRRQIAISVVGMSDKENLWKYEYAYNHKISLLCELFADKDYDVVLVSFCKPEQDEKAINDILALIDAKHIDKVKKQFYRGNIDRALQVLAESKYIIATRFHSMILGWVMGKPVFPIVYSDKMKHVIYDTGFVGDYVNVQNIDQLMPERVLAALELNNVFDVSTQIANSEKQFDKLDEFSK